MEQHPEFDLVVHSRDPKSGRIVSESPYRLVCDKDLGNHYERGGKKFFLDGTPMPLKNANAPKEQR